MPPSKSEYEVERILTHKRVRGKMLYFIKWRGFPDEWNTWEPEKNLSNCPQLLRTYMNVRLRQISSTPEHNPKATKVSRSPRLSRAWRKSSVQLKAAQGSSKASIKRETLPDVSEDQGEFKFCLPKDPPKRSVGMHDGMSSEASWKAGVDSQERRRFSLVLPATKAWPEGPRRFSLDTQTEELPDAFQSSIKLQPAHGNDGQPAQVQNLQSSATSWNSASSDWQPAEGNQTRSETNSLAVTPSEVSVDSKTDCTHSSVLPKASQSDRSVEEAIMLSNLGLKMVWPKITIKKLDEDGSFQQLGVAENSCRPFDDSNAPEGRVSQHTRPPAAYSRPSLTSSTMPLDTKRVSRRVSRQRCPVVDLTADSWTSADEAAFNSSQLSDSDPSWQNSTFVGRKFPNKLQVRLFDQTPRPEVLTSMPFLDTFESDVESLSEGVTDSSNKENLPKRRSRASKQSRKRGRPTAKSSSNCGKDGDAPRTRRPKLLAAAEVPAEDLPKTKDALVLLTELNTAGQSNMMMYFRRLNLVKSIPERMADKYYSQAVIDFYRRSMQPQPKVSRRSF